MASSVLTNLLLPPDPDRVPPPGDEERAAIGLQRWTDTAGRCGDADAADFMRAALEDPGGRTLIASVFGNSPHLGQLLLADPAFSCRLLAEGPDVCIGDTLASLDAPIDDTETMARCMQRMRVAKRRAALTIGIADMCGMWTLEQVTGALTDTAEAMLDTAVGHQLLAAHKAGQIELPDPARPTAGSGFIVLGMGKLGARELNYSSDIDLIVLYDPERVRHNGSDGPGPILVRVTRSVVKMMEERTGDGYVFRTDLRLRPDPGSTPIAMSTLAAELYYESAGQNWERAAMIKARPVAGDREAGQEFLDLLRSYVWRKNLDFAAIQDIHSIKRQINAHRGGGAVAIAGHNVKLGRGGIREIEFFAQTQQLIWGGREPALRPRPTCDALRALAEAGHVEPETAERLIEAYGFLRRLEHRLQMVNDQQTHSLPKDEAGLRAIAAFMGFTDSDAFVARLLDELHAVEEHYAQLFEESPDLGSQGNLVFTGAEDDPDTIETLTAMGYRDPSAVSAIVRSWHHGRYRATRSTRARELLTEMMPVLLQAFASTVNPNAALLKFNEFLAALPAGVQLFSLFHSNPVLLDQVADIMGSAPRLADALARNTLLLDGMLSADFSDPPPGTDELEREVEDALGQARDFQDTLDILRRWTNDFIFRVGLLVLRNTFDAEASGAHLSDAADTALRALYPRVEADFVAQHGHFEGGGMAVVALGKLGGREMTFASDLDLTFVYDSAGGERTMDTDRPLAASQYFARLAQRFINGVTAPTGEGKLYEIDMRLRPSGNAGPIATSIEALVRYHDEAAWTWEHMALTRARVINGPQALRQRIDDAVRAVLVNRRDPATLVRDVAEMRARMAKEHTKESDFWNIKHRRGGLVDIEFIAQYLQLRHAADDESVLDTNTTGALDRLAAAGCLDRGIANDLIAAMHLWRCLQGVLRLTTPGARLDDASPEGLRAVVCRTVGEPDLNAVKSRVDATAATVMGHYETLIAAPAAAAGPKPAK